MPVELVILDELTGNVLDGLGSDLIVTMDPGTVNFGMDVYQPALGVHVLVRIDLTLERDPATGAMRQHDIREKDLCKLAERVTEDYRDVLSRANVIGVEKQPPLAAYEEKKRGKINFIAFAHALLGMCMGKFPQAHVLSLCPRMRCSFFGTSGDDHDHRKRLTWWYCKSILSQKDVARVREVFGIDDEKGTGVDALDCMLYAIQVEQSYDALVAKALEPPEFKAANRRNTNNTITRQCVIPNTLFHRRFQTARARGLSAQEARRSLGVGPRPVSTKPPPKPRKRKPSAGGAGSGSVGAKAKNVKRARKT